MLATGEPAARDAGQTLIEMLVALAILTLIAGIAAPVLGPLLARRTLGDATAALATGVAEARADAIAHAAPVRLAIVPSGADGAMLVGSGAVSPARRGQPLPAGITLDWPRDGLVFYGDGTAMAWDGTIRSGATVRRFHIDPAHARAEFGA